MREPVPDTITLEMTGEVIEIPQGPFLSIPGFTWPFLIERFDEGGLYVSSCAPIQINSAGYLREVPEGTRVLRKKEEIKEARWYIWRGWQKGLALSSVQYAALKRETQGKY